MHVALKVGLGVGIVAGAGALLAACGDRTTTGTPVEHDDDILRAADNATGSDHNMHQAHEAMMHSSRSAHEAVQIIRAADEATGSDHNMLTALRAGLASQHAASGVVELLRGADNATGSDHNMLTLFAAADRAPIDPHTAVDIMHRADDATGSDHNAIELAQDMFLHAARSGGMATTPGPVDRPPVGVPSMPPADYPDVYPGTTSRGDD